MLQFKSSARGHWCWSRSAVRWCKLFKYYGIKTNTHTKDFTYAGSIWCPTETLRITKKLFLPWQHIVYNHGRRVIKRTSTGRDISTGERVSHLIGLSTRHDFSPDFKAPDRFRVLPDKSSVSEANSGEGSDPERFVWTAQRRRDERLDDVSPTQRPSGS